MECFCCSHPVGGLSQKEEAEEENLLSDISEYQPRRQLKQEVKEVRSTSPLRFSHNENRSQDKSIIYRSNNVVEPLETPSFRGQ